MKFETIDILDLSDLLSVCHHAGVTTVRLPHDLVDDDLSVIPDVKPLDPELGGDAQAIDKGLELHHIIGHGEVQSNHIEELTSLGRD
jgi:hypothetical protein